MQFSVIIPTYNAQKTLPDLISSLKNQTYDQPFEIIMVDDCSTDKTVEIARQYHVKILESSQNRGPAVCRNTGVKHARGEFLVFTDSDCRVAENWLMHIGRRFSGEELEALMGKLQLPSSTYMGDAISALGFPAGGSIGFDKIWRVDDHGFTESLSTCNCALRKDIFNKVGGFDETFPYPGGEDTLLAYTLRNHGFRIKYCPEVIVHHEPRTQFTDFIRWQFRRGGSSYIFSKKITQQSDFIKLRLWSIKNIISTYKADRKIPLILTLLFVGYFSQMYGYLLMKYNSRVRET